MEAENHVLNLFEVAIRKRGRNKWIKVRRSDRNLKMATKIVKMCNQYKTTPEEYLAFILKHYYRGSFPVYFNMLASEKAIDFFCSKAIKVAPPVETPTKQDAEKHNKYVMDKVRENFQGTDEELEKFMREEGFLQ